MGLLTAALFATTMNTLPIPRKHRAKKGQSPPLRKQAYSVLPQPLPSNNIAYGTDILDTMWAEMTGAATCPRTSPEDVLWCHEELDSAEYSKPAFDILYAKDAEPNIMRAHTYNVVQAMCR